MRAYNIRKQMELEFRKDTPKSTFGTIKSDESPKDRKVIQVPLRTKRSTK